MSADPHRATADAEDASATSGPHEIPHGAAARQLPLCDLVMKGGVTSGVVYPGLVQELAHRYRFANIGGSSAGAIAAGISAAAEFGRQQGNQGGMRQLDAAVEDLQKPGFLLGLFQPTSGTERLFDVLKTGISAQASRRSGMSPTRRIARVVLHAVLSHPLTLAVGILLLAGLAALAVAAWMAFPVVAAVIVMVLVVVPIAVLVVAATPGVAFGLLVRKAAGALTASDFGMCPGTQQEGRAEMALIDWLHQQIQRCAGRKPTDAPLTFGELQAAGIRLTMLSTDLAFARPIRVPEDLQGYMFDPLELRERFPGRVVDVMMPAASPSDAGAAGRLQLMPMERLPVLVGVRLSLSFPILLSAMPLYLPNRAADPPDVMRHLFSDGGISSNFPVHFFDAWVPSRPTFGIDLADHPGGNAENVFMARDAAEPLVPRWREISSLVPFLRTVFDTMQNWRDTVQTELPGFRDRVCQIRLREGEGGLNVDMTVPQIDCLIDRGHEAGRKILSTFVTQRWDQHRFIRYLTLMGLLQENLQAGREPFEAFAPLLEQGVPGVSAFREGRDEPWCRNAREATAQLMGLGCQWGPPPSPIDFRGADGPRPEPVMRVVAKA